MAKVAVVRCESYDYPTVKKAVEWGIDLLGGVNNYVSPGEKVLLKPNLLAAEPPESCVTTHPMVFKAVAEMLLGTGVQLSYGDSPGYSTPQAVANKSGFTAAANEMGIPMADFVQGEEAFFPQAIQNKKFVLARAVLENEAIISLPKLKTHGLTRMTGAIKNQFGCIPGNYKKEYHFKLPDIRDFAQMLVDINLAIKPRLYIMDGIMAMEGNGPRGGKPTPMNVLLLSADPVALDAVVCQMIKLKPEYVPTLQLGQQYGLGSMNNIELVGDPLESFIQQDFQVKREPAAGINVPGIKFLKNMIVPRPYIKKENCVRCGICVHSCPVKTKAVDWMPNDSAKDNPPVYDYNSCIRCYCCQEMCPEHTIEIETPWLGRLLRRFL